MKTRREYVTAMAMKVFGWKKDNILEDYDDEFIEKNQDNKQANNRKSSILMDL